MYDFQENWDLHVELDRLRASNAELLAAADMARICLKNRDQNELETKAITALRVAIAKARKWTLLR